MAHSGLAGSTQKTSIPWKDEGEYGTGENKEHRIVATSASQQEPICNHPRGTAALRAAQPIPTSEAIKTSGMRAPGFK